MPTNGARPLRYGSRSTDEPASASIAALRLRLAARDRVQLREAGVRRAAVLVPLVSADDGLSLLCFERTHDVLEHKGEICLPGGSIDPVDAGPVEAALREANEELGIEPGDVDVLGLLDDVHTTVSNYAITPVVGHISRPRDILCNALEVARPISVSVAALVERGVEAHQMQAPDGTSRTIYAYNVGGDRIWGATARIIHNMLTLWFGLDKEAGAS